MSIAEKLTTIAENMELVHKAGKKAQEQEFWEKYMNPSNDFSYRFAGFGWYKGNFKPVKDMKPTTSARRMFMAFDYYEKSGSDFDLVEHLKELDVTLDFSKCVDMQETFSSAHIGHIGVVDLTGTSKKHYGTFASAWIKKIDQIIVDEKKQYDNLFASAAALEEISITGTIGQNGFSASPCKKLNKASIESIINALSMTTSELSVTLSKTAVNKAFETSEGANDGSTSEEWSALEATKTNWTISLV